jgi:hypothetical protein
MDEDNNQDGGFQLIVNKRPGSPNTESRDPRKQPRMTGNASIQVNNRFQVLSNNETDENQTEKVKKPPPIYVSDVNNYEGLVTAITSIANGQEFVCKSNVKSVAIHPSTPALYRTIVHYFRSNNIKFHTYQLAEDKPYRIVIRGLHHSTPVRAISNELQTMGFQVRNVTNVLSFNKIPLPLFFIDLEQNDKNEEVYSLRTLLHTLISVEDPRPKRSVIQCTRCQKLGHTKSYCNNTPKCVRCAGLHMSKECTKTRDTPAKCALCDLDHPANYRGCSVYKNIQRLRQPQKNKPEVTTTTKASVRLSSTVPGLNTKDFPSLSSNQSSSIQHTTNNDISNAYSFNTFANKPSYSKITSSNTNQTQYDFLVQTMTNFMTDIKNLITPIMTLLTQLTQSLFQHVK